MCHGAVGHLALIEKPNKPDKSAKVLPKRFTDLRVCFALTITKPLNPVYSTHDLWFTWIESSYLGIEYCSEVENRLVLLMDFDQFERILGSIVVNWIVQKHFVVIVSRGLCVVSSNYNFKPMEIRQFPTASV